MSQQSDKKKFGFYQVGDYHFYSKREAIEMHRTTSIHPHWNFNESVFSQVDWKTEPKESLADLYLSRAQQIRQQYDYLVLWYSSGADCDNILKTFLDNDILIDEVVSFVNLEGSKDKNDHFMNSEVFNIAMPTVQSYQQRYPDLKFRLIDICQPTVDYFNDPKNALDWHYSMNTVFNPNSTMRNQLFRNVQEWQRLKDAGKSVCHIWGIDKPRLGLKNNQYFVRYLDIVDPAVSPKWQSENTPGEFIEFFYWTPDMPAITVKQAHVIKNYLRNCTPYSAYITHADTGQGYTMINGKKYFISNVGLNWLIYPKYVFNDLNEFKPKKLFWTPRDNWFYNLSENENAHRLWKTSLEALWASTPDYWKNDPSDPGKAFKSCVSPEYLIE
jgi:hypothetical protein